MERHLYRSRHDRVVAGVAGGLGEYFSIDPIIVRLLLILLALATGWGVLLYIVLLIVIPEAPREPGVPPPGYRKLDARERSLLLGATLVALGLALLAREFGFWWWLGLHRLWPLLLVAAGVALLVDQIRRAR
ncbi:MAG: PspC domain-containing protein [Anaerolineae bacterium]|nr:PspC domain-containing protein [Anaerolineae bacterium]